MVVILIRAVEEPPVSPLPLSTDSGSGSSIHKSSASTSTSGSRFNCYILNDKLKNNNHLRAFTTSSNSYSSSCSQADGDVIATTKEEEWVTKKKVELTTTRQIATRVQRQLVLEDGKVVEDSGPIVSTNTTEDTEKQEHKHTEHRTTGDDPPGDGWLAIPTEGEGLVKEVRERVVNSKEEQKELMETEDVKVLGDLSDQAYLDAVQSQKDVRLALRRGSDVVDSSALVSSGPRITHQSRSSRKIVDTNDAQELSRVHNGGIITETRRTSEHEEVCGEHAPEGGDSEEERELDHKQGTQRFAHTKEQALVQLRGNGGRVVAEQMRYQAENVENDAQGHPDPEWDSLSTRMQRMRRQPPGPAGVGSPFVGAAPPAAALDAAAAQTAAQARKDALTKKPLDFDQEEETRKMETSKWLEHHFGSDSRSSKSSVGEVEHPAVPTSANFINVTMKSRPIRATPSPRPMSPPEQKTLVFLSTPEPQSFVYSPPPPPAPVLPAAAPKTTRLLTTNRQNSSSSGSGTAGFFQGVSDWSERKSSTPPTKEPLGLLSNKTPLVLASNNVSPRVSSLVEALNRANTNISGGSSSAVKAASPTHHKQRDASPVISPPPAAAVPSAPSHGLNGSVSPGMGYTTQHQSTRPISPPQEFRTYEDEQVTWKGRTATASTARQQLARGELEQSHQRLDRHRSVELLRSRENLMKLERRYSSPRELEPPPDYSPKHNRRRSRGHSSPSPSPPLTQQQRRQNQKTRFADQHHQQQQQQQPKSKSSSFGDSLRRLVGKLRSNSNDKKKKQQQQQQQQVQNNHASNNQGAGRKVRPIEDARYSTGSEGEERVASRPKPPPRHRQRYASPQQQQQQQLRGDMEPRRYYLGEDPFGGSIYGREKEYDGVTPPGGRSRRTLRTERRGSQDAGVEEVKNVAWHQEVRGGTHSPPRQYTTTLGRYSRSTGRLQHEESTPNRSTQTLPRKLSSSKPISNGLSNGHSVGSRPLKSAGSMINVSIVNKVNSPPPPPPTTNGVVNSPAKPARTYRSNLARSQSFNVTEAPAPRRLFQQNAVKTSSYFRSNPHLHKLEESASPLKSPGIISSISRSQRDLHEAVEEERTSFNNNQNNNRLNGGVNVHDNKKKLFMKGLLDRAPELYRTLHGDDSDASHAKANQRVGHSSSFRNDLAPGIRPARSPRRTSNTLLSPSQSFRSSNGDDYSETRRFVSTTDDPVRPSVTNTVQSFSKKTVASPRTNGGLATETIESTETTTVTKSRQPFFNGNGTAASATNGAPKKYYYDTNRNGGVTIGVGNNH